MQMMKIMKTCLLSGIMAMLVGCSPKKVMPAGELVSVELTKSGTMAGYIYEGHVDRQENGEVVLKAMRENYGPLVTKTVDAEALKRIRDIIERNRMYAYKEDYRPSVQVYDGYSWHFYAEFDDGSCISSCGYNAGPKDDGLGEIRAYITELIGDTMPDVVEEEEAEE